MLTENTSLAFYISTKDSNPSSNSNMSSALSGLTELIAQNVLVLEASMKDKGIGLPALNDLYDPEFEFHNEEPEVARSIDMICRAALQLIQTVRPPKSTLMQTALSVSTYRL